MTASPATQALIDDAGAWVSEDSFDRPTFSLAPISYTHPLGEEGSIIPSAVVFEVGDKSPIPEATSEPGDDILSDPVIMFQLLDENEAPLHVPDFNHGFGKLIHVIRKSITVRTSLDWKTLSVSEGGETITDLFCDGDYTEAVRIFRESVQEIALEIIAQNAVTDDSEQIVSEIISLVTAGTLVRYNIERPDGFTENYALSPSQFESRNRILLPGGTKENILESLTDPDGLVLDLHEIERVDSLLLDYTSRRLSNFGVAMEGGRTDSLEDKARAVALRLVRRDRAMSSILP